MRGLRRERAMKGDVSGWRPQQQLLGRLPQGSQSRTPGLVADAGNVPPTSQLPPFVPDFPSAGSYVTGHGESPPQWAILRHRVRLPVVSGAEACQDQFQLLLSSFTAAPPIRAHSASGPLRARCARCCCRMGLPRDVEHPLSARGETRGHDGPASGSGRGDADRFASPIVHPGCGGSPSSDNNAVGEVGRCDQRGGAS